MSPPLFDFVEAKDKLTESAKQALSDKSSRAVINAFHHITGNETEKKTTLDQAFRVVLGEQIMDQASSCDDYLSLICMSIDAVTEGICSATTPFVLLGDVLDSLPLDQCDNIFTFVEENVATWKSNSFYTAGKNYLLRMCNDLLRRLSKSQNTVFCGRIQLFLARLFPLSEKSGLNLQSQFNLDNITVFNKNEDESTFGLKHTEEKEDGMEVEEGEMGEEEAPASCSIPIDYNLYRKFWTLQDYFRNPVQCYDKVSWMTFLKYSDETLAVFKSFKLDDMQASKRKLEELRASSGEHVYFAKFLTSEKLMDLQLSDSNFRRHILLQYLILFQYLKGQVKFKSSSCLLNDEQTTWIDETTKLVYQLLKEIPPDGDKFATMVERILSTEENWIAWKNEGCPSFVKERPADDKPKRPTRKRAAPEDFLGKGPDRKIFMGNDELTRLWNLNLDNMEACKSDTREFMPSLDEFFAEAIEQADPVNMVEEEYKVVRNPNYGWRALRLLSRRSPHFFQPTTQKFNSLADYLDSMVSKLAKELPKDIPSEEIKTGEDDDDENGDNLLKDSNDSPSMPSKMVSNQQMDEVAAKLGGRWKSLASHLEMRAAELREIENESEDAEIRAKLLLVTWQDREGAQATVESLVAALNAAGFAKMADDLSEA
ncbi:THO complex subunit 1 [Corythoichthys intestinalis]|uniref:THO complex subunit 1 n=1 Tax=Corythoichthys intestinalis TaxID=161448 RepID=UPI0025A56A7C|nr:THO complex subunit 1 [Corythoichthys intestinalis]XP_061795789.1 THO complex subunit 1-like [Nerophis lumbriciformis]